MLKTCAEELYKSQNVKGAEWYEDLEDNHEEGVPEDG
jgi:hypothetical protein